MADWSQLPKDLLIQIAESLDAPFDILRFRSVCSTWRTSVNPKPRGLPNRFPILPNDGISNTTWGFHLSKRTIYRISIPPINSESSPSSSLVESCNWIVKIEEDVPEKMHLLNPLSGVRFRPLPSSFVRNLDMLKFRVSELGQEYVMHYIDYRPFANSLGEATLYMEKVVFRLDGNPNYNLSRVRGGVGYKLLTIHVSGRLAMFESGEKKWKVIKEMPSPYDDVKLYKGKFYAVDCNGRAVVVESASKIELVAESVFGGDKKYLVECSGCLLLVDMYLTLDVEDGQGEDGEEEYLRSLNERIVRFKVYKLAEKEKKWVEMENLGDQILFLGENCTFSVSAGDLSGYDGNCIYMMNGKTGGDDGTGELHATDIGVYRLDSNNIESLTSESEDWKLFWPPPSWISTAMGVDKEMEDMSLDT